MLIPIGTDIRTRRTPLGNWTLIALNVLIFIVTDGLGNDGIKDFYALNAAVPGLNQYLTYQFLHGDMWHLVGNMLFLWIFGNAVCDRMGSICYVLFYLAGGVFAAFVFVRGNHHPLIGASGSIAAVTTAFLVLFPRVHVRLLLWFFFITTFQVPAMLLIVFKIILWDNVIAPSFGGRGLESSVAFSAHLGGYGFGFAAAVFLLTVRALPRNQFDLLALWDRWRRRTGIGAEIPFSRPQSARPVVVQELDSRPLEPLKFTPVEQLREDILDRLAQRDFREAERLYDRLLEMDAEQVLPRREQLEIGNHFAQTQQHARAVAAYESFLTTYPSSADAAQIRLLLGLINNRYLQRFEQAAEHLRGAIDGLPSESQRALAREELRLAEARISGPADEPAEPSA